MFIKTLLVFLLSISTYVHSANYTITGTGDELLTTEITGEPWFASFGLDPADVYEGFVFNLLGTSHGFVASEGGQRITEINIIDNDLPNPFGLIIRDYGSGGFVNILNTMAGHSSVFTATNLQDFVAVYPTGAMSFMGDLSYGSLPMFDITMTIIGFSDSRYFGRIDFAGPGEILFTADVGDLITAVPEPSIYAMLCLGLILISFSVSRQKKTVVI